MPTLETIVEKAYIRVSNAGGSTSKQIYRYQIESMVPDALVRLTKRLQLTDEAYKVMTAQNVSIDSNGVGTIPSTVNLPSITGGQGYIKLTDDQQNNYLPLSYEPNWDNRYLIKSNPNLFYYSIRIEAGATKIYVYKGDGFATPPDTGVSSNLAVVGVVIPTSFTDMDDYTSAMLVDILIEMCKESMGADQIPAVQPSNYPTKPVSTPSGQ